MTTENDEQGVELKADFYKSLMTFALATLGGEVALLQTVFHDSEGRIVAFSSIVLIVMACIFLIAAHEVLIRRVTPRPSLPGSWIAKLAALEPTSLEAEWVFSLLAGLFFGLGLALIAWFIVGA